MPVIGFLSSASPKPYARMLRRSATGYVEGRNVRRRWGDQV